MKSVHSTRILPKSLNSPIHISVFIFIETINTKSQSSDSVEPTDNRDIIREWPVFPNLYFFRDQLICIYSFNMKLLVLSTLVYLTLFICQTSTYNIIASILFRFL